MPSRDRLQSLLGRVRRRWLAQVGLRAVGRAAFAASMPLAGALVVARLLGLSDAALLILTAAALFGALLAGGLVVWQSLHRPSDLQVARFVEERATALGREPFDDVLVSAMEASREQRGGFADFVVRDAVRRLEAIEVSSLLPRPMLARAGGEAAVGIATLLIVTAFAWPMLGRAAETAWVATFPGYIQIQVLPGDARVAHGQPMLIHAMVSAGGRPLNRFTPHLTVAANGEERSVPMKALPNGFQFTFESVDRTFRYRVSAGSAQSEEYTVTALVPARVERIDLRYMYPSFVREPARDEADGGDIYAPAGTTVRVRVHTDKPIAAGQLALSGAAASLVRTGERVLEGELVLSRNDSYRVGLVDADGLRSAGDTEYFIRLMDDRPPVVQIVRPGGDQQITPLEEVAIEARAEDDHGLSRFELVYAVAGREPRVVPFTTTTGAASSAALGRHLLTAEDLRVQPGDVISYYARARDVGRGKRPTETRSDMYFLEVRPFSEEFVNAQSQSTAGLAGEQIEGLIAAQKEIINATWNIERRATAGAGRSASDIAAIAEAQAELKARAEQLASRAGRSGRVFPMQQVGPPRPQRTPGRPANDPVGLAISAMGRAVDQLNGQRPGDALAHEMAALQGLLQAQAANRLREVSQQAGAGGGSGRQGQDLSALFDKELQRQQRTNYETPARLEDQSETAPKTALDRIKDLAARQQELTRKLQDLARSELSADERRRQLETLMREQNRLRERMEDAVRQTSDSQSRSIADQMRQAAGELQRQNAESAAERAGQAASGLRRLEEELRDGGAARTAGEMSLEGQQIADEQRRIATEAARMAKAPAGADQDAWRRLAGEQDTLADRLDQLKQRAQEASAGRKPAAADGAQASAAVREIERQQLGARMRDSARQMRADDTAPAKGGRAAAAPAPAPAPARKPTGDAEQQIARALDQIVEQLGGRSSERAEDLSRGLDQAQDIRARLDRLERTLREAESRTNPPPAASGRSGAPAGRAGESGPAARAGGSDVQQLREQYAKEVQRARQELSRMEQSAPGAGHAGATPETHEWSVTDQGKEAFKQDFTGWSSLRKDLDSALERYESAIVARAARRSLDDRLSAGGSERVPDAYRALIARYYESLARKTQK